MRKVVVTEFVSLDGVMEAPGGDDGYVHGAWTIPYWCDEIGVFKTEELFAADSMLLGRHTYEGFAAAWPERTGDPFSDRMNTMGKDVVSATLTDPAWQNTTVHTGDLAAIVRALKDGDGGDLLVVGSATLVHGLLRADLVDELRLATYPVTLGVGKRLYPADTRLDFELVGVTTAPTGVTLSTYRRTFEPADSGLFPDRFRE
jgi:dihydrofolate reductase